MFTKEQLELPYDKLPEELMSDANYSLARVMYEDKIGKTNTSKITYNDYLKTNKDKNIGFCEYLLSHAL